MICYGELQELRPLIGVNSISFHAGVSVSEAADRNVQLDRWRWALLGLMYDHHGEFTSEWHCYYRHNRVFKPPLWHIHELEHTLSPVNPPGRGAEVFNACYQDCEGE